MHARGFARSNCKHHHELCSHCFLLKLTYRLQRKSKHTGRGCIREPEHSGCCCPWLDALQQNSKRASVGEQKTCAPATSCALHSRSKCAGQSNDRDKDANLMESVVMYFESTEDRKKQEKKSEWRKRWRSRLETGGCLWALQKRRGNSFFT